MNKDRNTGNRNTGNRNTGDWNTGNSNTGNSNTGYRNTGDWNTGHWNTGDRNTGHWNTCDMETGFFNTNKIKTIRAFNKDCHIELWNSSVKPDFLFFNLTEWVYESEMTDREKTENPSYKATGGYLKKYDYKEAFKKSWNEATQEDRDLLFKLPNFDANVFEEISGINVNESSNEMTIEDLEKLTGIKNLKIKK